MTSRGERREVNGPGGSSVHETTFPGDWRLRVILRPNATLSAELRRDDVTYSLISSDPGLIDMFLMGYDVNMSVDNEQRPTIIWRPGSGVSAFVWFCGIGVADWSHPV